ncbi:MAG: hypothetical protein JNK82_44565, partial [Myxococcaceae bacterium]|nr:hypothetical protein [Myxococcaceae bacterium]
PLTFMAFRPGYQTKTLGAVNLRPGEELNVGTLTLAVDPSAATPGTIKGQLVLRPAAARGDLAIGLVSPLTDGVVADDLSFRIDGVPMGLYTLRASRTGYSEWLVRNVVVLPGLETELGDVELTTSPPLVPLDGGPVVVPDGGGGGGMDGGGVPDAGGGGNTCASNAACGAGQWCDQGMCSPQCGGVVTCSSGRTCDSATNTCVRSCAQGCGAGFGCESATNLCRARCDLVNPCNLGFVCSPQGLCLPECSVLASTCSMHQTCLAGQCVSNTTCTTDVDCTDDATWCELGRCEPRPTLRGAAGRFVCSTACECRLDEWCGAGECHPDKVPTVKLTADGGVNVWGVIADAGPDDVIALRSTDVFVSSVPFRFGGVAHRARLGGGYVECSPTRWVRSDATRSTLRTASGTVLQVMSGGSPVLDPVVQNFTLENRPPGSMCPAQLMVSSATRPTVRFIDGHFEQNTCGASAQDLVYVDSVPGATVSDVTLLPSGLVLGVLRAVHLFNSSGTVENVRLAPQPGSLFDLELVLHRSGLSGLTTIRGTRLSALTSTGDVSAVSVSGNPGVLVIENSDVRWPSGLVATSSFTGVSLVTAGDATVRNNVIDGSGQTGPLHPAADGIFLNDTRGEVSANRIVAPQGVTPANDVTAIAGIGIAGPLAVTDNVIVGGVTRGTFTGISLTGLNGGGPSLVARNQVYGGAATTARGIDVLNAGANSQLQVFENDVTVSGRGGCTGSATAVRLQGAVGARVERNRLAATNAPTVAAMHVRLQPVTELYGNHLWAGPNSCTTPDARSIAVWAELAPVTLGGNTLEAEGAPLMPGATEAIACEGAAATVSAESNVIGAGSAQTHRFISATSSPQCTDGGTWAHNVFWYRRPGAEPLAAGEQVSVVLDGGNVLVGNTSPFDGVQPVRPDGGSLHDFRLSASSVCIDTGALAVRPSDGTPVTLDLLGRTRDAGVGVDIGCCERW